MRILLVDDDPAANLLYSALLGKSGHEIVQAEDGEEAWEAIQREEINLVITDWMMPRLSGPDLCRRIRSGAFGHYIYVILCTAKEGKSDLIEGMEAGADDFLVKPISRGELRVRIRAGERILQLERGLADRNRELAGANERLQSANALIRRDLEAASWLQENLLPPRALSAGNVACRWRFRPSSYVAGDMFNFFELDSTHVGFYMLDVSGHGVPAAMLSVTLSMMLAPESVHGSPMFALADPTETVNELNRRFTGRDERYFTMIYAVADTQRRMLRMAQAGHPNPVLIKASGELRTIGTGGMPVGIIPDIDFDTIEVAYGAGDRLILYSDGITECMNSDSDVFGEDRLLACLSEGRGKTLDDMLSGVETALDRWRGGAEFRDDVSLMGLDLGGAL